MAGSKLTLVFIDLVFDAAGHGCVLTWRPKPGLTSCLCVKANLRCGDIDEVRSHQIRVELELHDLPRQRVSGIIGFVPSLYRLARLKLVLIGALKNMLRRVIYVRCRVLSGVRESGRGAADKSVDAEIGAVYAMKVRQTVHWQSSHLTYMHHYRLCRWTNKSVTQNQSRYAITPPIQCMHMIGPHGLKSPRKGVSAWKTTQHVHEGLPPVFSQTM